MNEMIGLCLSFILGFFSSSKFELFKRSSLKTSLERSVWKFQVLKSFFCKKLLKNKKPLKFKCLNRQVTIRSYSRDHDGESIKKYK